MKKNKIQHPNSLKNLKPVKKGEIRNPEGGRAHDPIKKELKRITQESFKECIEMALGGNLSGLQEIVDDPNSPALKVGIATALHRAIKLGDWHTLQSIIERIVGKVVVKVDHTTDGEKINQPASVIILPAKKPIV